MTKAAILKYWENVRKLTLKMFDFFPEDRFDFKPTETVRTVAEQFDHILVVELFTRIGILTGEWNATALEVDRNLDRAYLRNKLYNEHKKTMGMLRLLPEGRFMRTYDTLFGELTGEVAIYEAIDEEIHHRGNLYVYLRMLGIEPPQMIQNYGELLMEDRNGF
ncbi:MAG: DinB family protein [candidate division Zixibacteria bacterium]